MARLPTIDNSSAIQQSVHSFTDRPITPVYMLQIATAADEAPAWWSPRRDQYLDAFWPTEPYLAGAVYSVASRNASFRYELTGTDRDAWWAQQLLSQADFGQGWQSFIMKLTIDYLTCGNGAFFEIIRPTKAKTKSGDTFDAVRLPSPTTGDPVWMPYDSRTGKFIDTLEDFKIIDNPLSLPVGIAHLDSHRCLGRDSRVLMADGTKKSILSLVRQKHPGPVMAVDENGNLVPKVITSWYESSLDTRYWLHIETEYATCSFGRKQKLWVTNDHLLLTPNGWCRADSLSIGDRIVTRYPDLSDRQKEVLTGTLLGDASLSWYRKKSGAAVNLIQSVKQEDWFFLKIKAFENLVWNSIRKHTNSFDSTCLASSSLRTPALSSWANQWYVKDNRKGKRKRKVVPRDLVSKHFTPLMLAAWYMDDGNLQTRAEWGRPAVRLYTLAFSEEDVEWLASKLTECGYEAKAYCNSGKESQYYIYITPDGSEKFFADIAPYIPDAMRYKLPDGYPEYNPNLWENISDDSIRYADYVVNITSGTNGDQATAFCIDVEDHHNFIAADMVVHNCTRTGIPEYPVVYTDLDGKQHKLSWYQVVTIEEMPSPREEMHNVQHSAIDRCLRLSQILRDMLIYKHEKISGRFARAVHLTNADAQLLQDAIDQAKEDADNRALQRYLQPIIISTVDPTAKPEVATIPLASLPDGFSEEETMRWYIAGIANAFGVDYGFLSPLPGNKLGTSNQAETQERQARGKSSRLFMQTITNKLNYSGILPRTVEFQFAVSDPWEESEQDSAFARRTRGYQALLQSGLLPDWVVRQMASDKGDIDPRYLEMMGETDQTPIITISGTDVRRAHRVRVPVQPQQPQLPGIEEEDESTQPSANGEGE